MDLITHAVSGTALALARNAKRREIVWLALAAMAPDADIVLRLVSDVFYLEHHRGITHSLLLVPLWAWWLARLVRPQPGRLSAFWIGMALLLHIVLDWITSFGTMLFAPFTRTRFSLDWVFILDPLLTLPTLILCLLELVFARARKAWGAAALFWLGLYLAVAGTWHAKAIGLAQRHAKGAHVAAALPLPFSPFRWRLVLDEGQYWRIAAVDFAPWFAGSTVLFPSTLVRRYTPKTLTGPDALLWRFLPKPDWQTLPDDPGVRFYRWFARLPVLLVADGRRTEIGDLRFMLTEDAQQAPFRLRITLGRKRLVQLIWREGRASPLR